MDEFEPRSDTRDVNARFMTFAKGIMYYNPAAGAGYSPASHSGKGSSFSPAHSGKGSAKSGSFSQGHGCPRGDIDPAVADFITRWDLDSGAVDLLSELSPDACATVLETFDPRGDTRNVFGKLRAFANAVAAGHGPRSKGAAPEQHFEDPLLQEPGVEDFLLRWGLEVAPTLEILGTLSLPHLETLMAEFDPRGDTRNVLGKLRAFANTIVAGHMPRNKPAALREMEMSSHHRPEPSLEIQDFAARWGLDSDTAGFLSELSAEHCSTVLEQFDPRGDTRNVCGKLRAFANTIVAGRGPRASGAGTPGGGGSVSSWSDPVISEFVRRWHLDPVNTPALLGTLSPDVLQTVLREFGPRADTQNVDGKLRAFVSTIAAGAFKGGSKGGKERDAFSFSSFAGAKGGAFKGSPSKGGVTDAASSSFLTRWGLNSASRDVLASLSPQAQAVCMSEFQPRGDTHDINGKFCGFARSIGVRYPTSASSSSSYPSRGSFTQVPPPGFASLYSPSSPPRGLKRPALQAPVVGGLARPRLTLSGGGSYGASRW